MAKLNSNPKPAFFWQGALILLPMAVLAVVGLFSLRQDRLLAEQEARELGASLARRLAEVVGEETARQLGEYRNANFSLHASRMADLSLSRWSGGSNTQNSVTERIRDWQQANPGIDLSVMPVSDGWLGVPVERSSPQIYPLSPQPPDWLLELSPDQRRLWQKEEQAEFTDPDAAVAAMTNFLATKPPVGARASAESQLMLLQTRGQAPTEALAALAAFPWSASDQLNDAGLPVGQLVCYRTLRLLPDHAGIPNTILHTIAWAIEYRASILSPRLITETERVAAQGPAGSKKSVATLKAWWDSEERARAVLRDFLEQHPPDTWSNALFWVASSGDRFLLALNAANPPPEATRPFLIFPQAVVDKALDDALAEGDVPLPTYAVAGLEIGGKDLALRRNQFFMATNVPLLPVLGEAAGTLSALPFNTNGYPFRVRVFLADRDVLYARQRQRTLLFGAMILASTLAALAGLVAARRAFYRQLQLNEMKSNFVSSVSHELRAPIASVRLMAENLERGKIPEATRQNEYFRFIVQECRRLSSLIENVLDFSRIEQGRKQYQFEPADFTALARTTAKLMEPYAAEKGVKLETSGIEAPASNIELNVDGRALQQALVNLIDNAIKHSPRGETVTVGMEMKNGPGGAVHLFVADHGPGIPAGEHEKIFERFYRCGSELRRETQGVGIGLSVVQHIVAAHGGRVVVQSEVGQGSRFTIELPGRSGHE